ncbi:hypothetical protein Tco_0785540, partial [Tanacetum coccineum]
MESPDFARYWSESERMIPRKGDQHDYWRDISTDGDFLGPPPSYTLIRDLVLRLCHRMMAHDIAGRGQAPEKFIARLAEHFRLLTAEILGGLTIIAPELQIINMAELAPQYPPLPLPAPTRTMPQRMARLEEDIHKIRKVLTEQREEIDAMAHDFSRFSTWVTTGLGQMMDRAG